MRSKHKQNWINHLERMDNTRLPKHVLNYNVEEEEIVDAPGKDGNASMPEHVKLPNPWRTKKKKKKKKMMISQCWHIFAVPPVTHFCQIIALRTESVNHNL